MTARIADGVVLQLADPDLIRWFVGQLRDAAAAAGRDPSEIQVMAAAPAHVGDMDMCRDRVRWFPALVSNHVVDLVNKYDPADLPPGPDRLRPRPQGLRLPAPRRGRLVNAAFVGDDVVDRFCVIGPVEDHLAQAGELADAGVTQFNIYLMNGDEEETLEFYGREIIPATKRSRRQPGLTRPAAEGCVDAPGTSSFPRPPCAAWCGPVDLMTRRYGWTVGPGLGGEWGSSAQSPGEARERDVQVSSYSP